VQVVPLRSGAGALSVLLTHQLGRPVVNGRRIAGLLRRGSYDVINFHNVSLIGGPGLLRYGAGIKLYMAHEHWLVCPTHVLWRHRKELCTGRECLRCQLAYNRPPQLWRHTRYLERQLGHVDAFIAMSAFSRDKHREFGFPREMEVLPCLLPDTGLEANALPQARPHPRPYLLFVGRLERIKGLQDVLPAFEGDGETDLLVAGEGEFGNELRARAAGLPRVRFLGRLPREDLPPYYRHAVALIVPSACYETFGIILLEAFRQGTPVVARRLGPFPEIISASGGGELFTTRDELVAAIQRLHCDRAYRDRLGRAGRAAFEARWSSDVVVPRYLEIVQRAAERRGRPGLAPPFHPTAPLGAPLA
jgi:glycosyltransferase involved in cell wall biosynthesis